jgi:hypothetical protein
MNQGDVVNRVTSRGVQFIIECIKGGYADYNNPTYYGPIARREHTASVAAACINCHIIERAKRMSVSDEMQGLIRISQKRGRTTFILADYTEVWYKKLNKDGKPSFRVSQQALDYVEPPQPMLNIKMPPEKIRVVAGYRPYGAGTEFEYEVLVTGPDENGNWWEIRLLGIEIPELFPAPAPAPVPDSTAEVLKKRVHVRKAKKSKANDDESEAQSV